MTPQIKATPGETPEFWDRSIVFIANLLSIFYGNQGQTEDLRRQVGGLETYGGRLIPIINLLFRGGKNLLLLEAAPDGPLLDYFSRDLRLELPAFETLSHARYLDYRQSVRQGNPIGEEPWRRLRAHPADWCDGFVTDQILVEVAQSLDKKTISSLAGSRRGNNKLLLHEHLQRSGLPSFDTYVAEKAEHVGAGLARLRGQGYERAVVKSQVGASGIGMCKVATSAEDVAAIPEFFFHEGPCLVQGWFAAGAFGIRRVHSPSVQMFLSDDTVNLYDITEQILSGDSIHEGNVAPPRYIAGNDPVRAELLNQAGNVGSWLHGEGYRGTASVDFLVLEKSAAMEVYVCEINARVTGATYPAVLARNFRPRGAWLMRNIGFATPLDSRQIVDLITAAGCLFQAGGESGIMPINFNATPAGVHKGQFLFIGTDHDECVEEMERVNAIFPVKTDYDRD